MMSKERSQIIKDDEIDLIALIKTIWEGRKTIYYSIGVAVFLGLIIAFASPAKYTASATLLPSAEKKGGSLGNLGALAGMAGINLGSMMGNASGIPAEIYPEVIDSYPFKNELVHQRFYFEKLEEPVSIYEYVVADTIPTIGGQIFKYTVGLPWLIKDALLSKEEEQENIANIDVIQLSEAELNALGFLEDLFMIEVDQKTGLVSISAEVEEPVLVAQLVKEAVILLQKYIIEFKTQQAREHLEFVQARYSEKKAEYIEAQKAFFSYKDSHRNIVSERINIEYQSLSDQYDIASTVFKDLAKQLEAAKIAVKEQTPAFAILEPAKVPIEKSTPKKKFILFLTVFSGIFVGIGVVFGKIVFDNLTNS
jgi:uncharacterized protein involved in exopolysaccharide biosynthesis